MPQRMRIAQVIAAVMLLTQQVVSFLPAAQTASIAATNRIAVEVPKSVQVNFATSTPVTAVIATADIESQMLEPLRTSQAAQAAAEAQAKAQATAAAEQARMQAQLAAVKKTVTVVSYATGSLSAAAINYLGNCESGMTWNRNSGNGFYGAFQFTIGTWNNMNTGYARADLAPLDVQVQAVQNLLSRSSIYSQFPACARKMSAAGLI